MNEFVKNIVSNFNLCEKCFGNKKKKLTQEHFIYAGNTQLFGKVNQGKITKENATKSRFYTVY